jgi:hypothetical protein
MKLDESIQPTFASWIRDQARDDPRVLRTQRRPRVEDLRCHPDLCARLAACAADLPEVTQRYLCGFPVLVTNHGVVFGVAAGTAWMALRLPAIAAGAVVRTRWGPRELGGDWVDVDPWLTDMPSWAGTRRLFGWCHTAHDHAASPPTRRA